VHNPTDSSHIMTQRCFMLCTTYTNVWFIICPLEVRCLSPLSKIFQLLLLWRKLRVPREIHSIWTFSRCFSRNLTPREAKIILQQFLCFIYFNNLVKYFFGPRLRRCLISSKTVQISRAKFHEIQKTNNAYDVTMTSNAYRFCWKQVLTSKVWSRL
jgi:hypothetical protein